jgi:hypothetical protein
VVWRILAPALKAASSMPAVGAKKSRLATASDARGAMDGGFLQRRAKDFTVANAEFV